MNKEELEKEFDRLFDINPEGHIVNRIEGDGSSPFPRIKAFISKHYISRKEMEEKLKGFKHDKGILIDLWNTPSQRGTYRQLDSVNGTIDNIIKDLKSSL